MPMDLVNCLADLKEDEALAIYRKVWRPMKTPTHFG